MKKVSSIYFILLFCSISSFGQKVYYFNPHWSPNAGKIVFESTKDGKSAIYVIKKNGKNLKRLTSGDTQDAQPRWSRDGRKIIFISDRVGHSQLYIMNADGSDQRRVTNSSDDEYVPDLSPGQDMVLFASTTIMRARIDGSERLSLTDKNGDYESPKWSPDGEYIIFSRSDLFPENLRDRMSSMSREERQQVIRARDNSAEIFIMNKDGSIVKNLTNNNTRDHSPEWSRDGKLIYLISNRSGSPNVYSMSSAGSDAQIVADGDIVTGTNVSKRGCFVYSKEAEKKWGLYIYNIRKNTERLLIN